MLPYVGAVLYRFCRRQNRRSGGGGFLLYLAWGAFRDWRHFEPVTVEPANTTQSVAQAALINALNPNPWLFWSAVGGPLLLAAWQVAPVAAALFILGFYGMLVG